MAYITERDNRVDILCFNFASFFLGSRQVRPKSSSPPAAASTTVSEPSPRTDHISKDASFRLREPTRKDVFDGGGKLISSLSRYFGLI